MMRCRQPAAMTPAYFQPPTHPHITDTSPILTHLLLGAVVVVAGAVVDGGGGGAL